MVGCPHAEAQAVGREHAGELFNEHLAVRVEHAVPVVFQGPFDHAADNAGLPAAGGRGQADTPLACRDEPGEFDQGILLMFPQFKVVHFFHQSAHALRKSFPSFSHLR